MLSSFTWVLLYNYFGVRRKWAGSIPGTVSCLSVWRTITSCGETDREIVQVDEEIFGLWITCAPSCHWRAANSSLPGAHTHGEIPAVSWFGGQTSSSWPLIPSSSVTQHKSFLRFSFLLLLSTVFLHLEQTNGGNTRRTNAAKWRFFTMTLVDDKHS